MDRRGPYKRYLVDSSIPIPKKTLNDWRHRQANLDIALLEPQNAAALEPDGLAGYTIYIFAI